MTRTKAKSLLLLSCLFSAHTHADAWLRAETPNFLVYSDVGESKTRRYVEELEAFKYLAELILGNNPSDTAASKFTLYLLERSGDLKKVRPGTGRFVAGYYTHCIERAQAFVFVPQMYGMRGDEGLQILLHEYGHHLMFSRMQRFYPSWYVEGFAEYLGTTRVHEGSFVLGDRQEERAAQLAAAPRWIDFNVLLDPKRFAAAVKKQELNVFQFYAQSWLLAHYMQSDPARARAFNAYFDRIGRGEDGAASFEAETGMTPAQLRTAMGSYRREFAAMQVKVPARPNSTITLTTLPRGQGDYLIEAAALLSCPDEKHGRNLTERFRAMRAKRPHDLHLGVELSRAELLFGDPKVARKELEMLADSNAPAFDVTYLLGRSYYEEAKQAGDQQQHWKNKASEQFLKAYQLDKTHAPNLYFLSKSLDTGGVPSKSVVNAATAAAILVPSVREYALHGALVNLRSGDRDTAIRVLQPFASNPHELDNATQVAALINSIRGNEESSALIAKLEELGAPPKVKDEEKKKDEDKQ